MLYGGKSFTVEGDTIIIRYFDGTVKKEKYTKERVKELLNEMLEEAKELVKQRESISEYIDECKRKEIDYKFKGDVAWVVSAISAPFLGLGISSSNAHISIKIASVFLFLTVLIRSLKYSLKAIDYSENADETHSKLVYFENLAEYLNLVKGYEDLGMKLNIQSTNPPLPPLDINTFDEYNKEGVLVDILLEATNNLWAITIEKYLNKVLKNLEKHKKTNSEPAIIEKMKREMDEEKAPAINTYNHLDDYHYEHKPKVLSKVLVNPFKDLEI